MRWSAWRWSRQHKPLAAGRADGHDHAVVPARRLVRTWAGGTALAGRPAAAGGGRAPAPAEAERRRALEHGRRLAAGGAGRVEQPAAAAEAVPGAGECR